ncbi:MAG: hypothetical protein E7447_05980 [Ruminococcaceae bacterium]|nr:hypothetical protein [Oscillospiraceae bacterium]
MGACPRGDVCRFHHLYAAKCQLAKSGYGQAGGRTDGGL